MTKKMGIVTEILMADGDFAAYLLETTRSALDHKDFPTAAERAEAVLQAYHMNFVPELGARLADEIAELLHK